jgi:hypothetical protein
MQDGNTQGVCFLMVDRVSGSGFEAEHAALIAARHAPTVNSSAACCIKSRI